MKAFAALSAADANRTYFSPPMLIEFGVRTGKFRLGKSWVSFEDYAIALAMLAVAETTFSWIWR